MKFLYYLNKITTSEFVHYLLIFIILMKFHIIYLGIKYDAEVYIKLCKYLWKNMLYKK